MEVLGCDHLPNLDISLTGRDKTDAFACLVFEDCIVNTDVINDTLSPRWMPWSQRAFILNIMHPSSQLMVGVFDHDSGIADPGHDPVGRAVVNLTNLRQGTEYTLTYVLYESYREERVARGSITLRIRVEIPNNRKTPSRWCRSCTSSRCICCYTTVLPNNPPHNFPRGMSDPMHQM